MVINDLLNKGVTLMKGLEYANPILESILILSHLLGVDKLYVYTYGHKEVDRDIYNKFMEMVERRAKGYPLAYILKGREFMGWDFYLEEGVLIPRPETEIMVEYIIGKIKEDYGNEKISILEIGIGSGAISLSIAKSCPQVEIYGVDLNPKAIEIANINMNRFKLNNVFFYEGNLFEPIRLEKPNKKFNIIISNPPYIKSGDIGGLQKEVKDFEPLLALDGGRDGLDFYRKITRESKNYLEENGLLVYEIGYDQGKEVKDILLYEGLSHISLLEDFQGHDRVVSGALKRKGE